MAFPPFPNEILLAIISWIPPSDHATLRACQLTNRTFNEFSTSVLYQHLDIGWVPNRGIPLLRTLEEKPSLSNLVKSATVDYMCFHSLDQSRVERSDELEELERARIQLKEEQEGPNTFLDALDPKSRAIYDERRRVDLGCDCWEQAEMEAWARITQDGNARWLEQEQYRNLWDSKGVGRREGADLLSGLLTSLPNLLRLDLDNFDCGSLTLPHLSHLTITNSCVWPEYWTDLPTTPNVEELIITGFFNLSPDNIHLPKLHTLLIDSEILSSLLPRLFEASKAPLRTLDVCSGFHTRPDPALLADFLGPVLASAPGLETLSISRQDVDPEDLSALTSFLPFCSLRNISLPFIPSPANLLFTSLPSTTANVNILRVDHEVQLLVRPIPFSLNVYPQSHLHLYISPSLL
ncbi:hypothetical protein RQP46_001665 [Phenoliferia psychrophenolica]